jgi:tetraacyldisaccharide 4'-kinase
VGQIYGSIVEMRFRRQKPYRSRLPVICVGNFTAGGTGTTPLTLHLIGVLKGLKERPACLTRGYGGSKPGPAWVRPGIDTAREVGDEALLLARSAPTLVARNRKTGAEAMEASDASVVVMDDGLQNAALEKDLVIAVVDGVRGLGNEAVFPAGPLRAPLDFQLALVDCIVVNGVAGDEAHSGGSILDRLKRTFPGPVLAGAPEPSTDAAWLEGRRVIAYAGIGHPERFFKLLRRLGAEVEQEDRFPDHHEFTPDEAAQLLRNADACDATLVTTEKDLARLSGATGARAELHARSRALPIRLAFDERDQIRLEGLVETAVKRKAEASG